MLYRSNNRLIYDKCTYQRYLKESMAPLNYRFYPGQYKNCHRCAHYGVFTPMSVVILESELRRLDSPMTKCDKFKHNPYVQKKIYMVRNCSPLKCQKAQKIITCGEKCPYLSVAKN